jgi:hypothetical protein
MNPIRRRQRISLLPFVLALALGGCDSPTEPPTVASVSGEYQASTLALTQGGQSQDFLAVGAELTVSLKPDGTTTGRLFVPEGDEDGRDLREDLMGRWTLRGDTVRFQQGADTFLRDMPFLVRGRRLEGEYAAGGGRLRVVLQR